MLRNTEDSMYPSYLGCILDPCNLNTDLPPGSPGLTQLGSLTPCPLCQCVRAMAPWVWDSSMHRSSDSRKRDLLSPAILVSFHLCQPFTSSLTPRFRQCRASKLCFRRCDPILNDTRMAANFRRLGLWLYAEALEGPKDITSGNDYGCGTDAW